MHGFLNCSNKLLNGECWFLSNTAAVDVNRIARELDFKSLQENIMNITFCNIEAEMVRLWLINITKLVQNFVLCCTLKNIRS